MLVHDLAALNWYGATYHSCRQRVLGESVMLTTEAAVADESEHSSIAIRGSLFFLSTSSAAVAAAAAAAVLVNNCCCSCYEQSE